MREGESFVFIKVYEREKGTKFEISYLNLKLYFFTSKVERERREMWFDFLIWYLKITFKGVKFVSYL